MVSGINEPVIQICAVVCQNVRIRDIKKDLLDPVISVHRIEGHPYLIKLSRRKFPSETVVYNFKISLRDLRCLFDPHVRQLAALKGNRFQLLALLFIVHAPEYDLVPVMPASKRQRALLDIPVSVCLIAEHPISCACQLRIGAVTVRDI